MGFLKELDKNNSISLYKFSGEKLDISSDKSLIDNDKFIKVSFLDFETTGLDFDRDEVIEIGLKTLAVNREDYQEFYINSVKEDMGHNKDQEMNKMTKILEDFEPEGLMN